MKVPEIKLAQTIVKLCEYKKIKHIVISPGSRNAPLTIGFSNNDYFNCYSIVDERCAAFFALGIAQQKQEPVALLCTSGSALLNYYPAIAEAYYSDIPLIILSADRPKKFIGIGDGQTINQKGVYGSHILYEASLKDEIRGNDINFIEDDLTVFKSDENESEYFPDSKQTIEKFNSKEINKALNTAILKKGPVHINIPFDEPLYELQESYSVNSEIIDLEKPLIEEVDLTSYKSIWSKSKRKMVLVGVNFPESVNQKYLDILANDESVIVFTESTSNLHHENFFPSIDQIIAPLNDKEFKELQPEIILTFGGLVVSKKIKAFLRKYQPKHHWHIGENKANDTFFSLDKHFKLSVNEFFKDFLEYSNVKSSYYPTWNLVRLHRLKLHDRYLMEIPFSDFKVFDTVLKCIPNNTIVQSGNSSAIRYLQLFDLNKTLRVFCNRGTSGIDGSTSTAIGSAVVNIDSTIFITGDLSFFYDSNALWNNYIPKNFRIILLNNKGGGIFRILPGYKNTENFDTYFETKHNLTAEHLCNMYGFEYSFADNEESLDNNLNNFFNPGNGPKLIEVFTPRILNDEVLLKYFEFIK